MRAVGKFRNFIYRLKNADLWQKNGYSIVQQIDFSTICEGVEQSFLRMSLSSSKKDDKQMREQIIFSVVQKFYEKAIELSEKPSDK